MISASHHQRFEKALNGIPPAVTLHQLAIDLRDEGISQIEVYFLFSHFQERTSGEDPRYDAIVDTMDEIYGGPWAKRGGVFASSLTEQAIQAGRKAAEPGATDNPDDAQRI
jgi:hypothetical protein